jgi:TolB-like protein
MRARCLMQFGAMALCGVCSAALADAPAAHPADVMVMPFSNVGPPDATVPAWVGTAVQQNLSADLARFHLQPAAPTNSTATSAAPASPDAPVDPSVARYIIRGSFQSTDGTIRFDGEIIESGSNGVVGGLSATGPLRDLFALEDSLSMQAVHQLGRLLHPTADPATQPAPAVAEVPAIPTESYDGSALAAYVNSNLPPSNDYWDQLAASRDRQMYGTYPAAGYSYGYGGFGYGFPIGVGVVYGAGFPVGTIGSPYSGGYFGGAYGGSGYGGFGSYGGGFHGHGR